MVDEEEVGTERSINGKDPNPGGKGVPGQGDDGLQVNAGRSRDPAEEAINMPLRLNQWMVRGDNTLEEAKAILGILVEDEGIEGEVDWGKAVFQYVSLKRSVGGKAMGQFVEILTKRPVIRMGFGDRVGESVGMNGKQP